jgi:hypothetical protein
LPDQEFTLSRHAPPARRGHRAMVLVPLPLPLLMMMMMSASSEVGAMWVDSSPVNPLPKGAVMISNATLNPVAVYECAVRNTSTSYVAGALAFERSWRCMYFDPTSPSQLSAKGPGQYQVYTDPFDHAKGVEATAAKPFPAGTIVPLFNKYQYATGCQTTYAEVIGGLPYYFPAYGTAMPGPNGNFVCRAASFKLHTEGRYVSGAPPYQVATDQ